MTYPGVNFPGVLNDDRDWQVHIVSVDKTDCEACEACKGSMHSPLPQNLQRKCKSLYFDPELGFWPAVLVPLQSHVSLLLLSSKVQPC